jgi:ATP-dependent Clp protease, protease subunit
MGRITKDWVDAYFDHGVDIANRRVFLVDDVEDSSISDAIKGLYLMETSSKSPIEVFISSSGGSVYEMFALYDIFSTLKCPVHTFAYGKCMSAATLLLAAGQKGDRWCTPNTWFMMHDLSYELAETKHEDAEGQVNHGKDLRAQWLKEVVKCSDKDMKFWSAIARKSADQYFTAEQAIEWGVADHFWVEK